MVNSTYKERLLPFWDRVFLVSLRLTKSLWLCQAMVTSPTVPMYISTISHCPCPSKLGRKLWVSAIDSWWEKNVPRLFFLSELLWFLAFVMRDVKPGTANCSRKLAPTEATQYGRTMRHSEPVHRGENPGVELWQCDNGLWMRMRGCHREGGPQVPLQ